MSYNPIGNIILLCGTRFTFMQQGILTQARQNFQAALNLSSDLLNLYSEAKPESQKEKVRLLEQESKRMNRSARHLGIKIAADFNRKENAVISELLAGGYQNNPIVQVLLCLDQVALLEEKLLRDQVPVNTRSIALDLKEAFKELIATIHSKTQITLQTLFDTIKSFICNCENFNYPQRLITRVFDYINEIGSEI